MADRTTTFPLTGQINLLVKIGSGSVTVIARDDLTEATVVLTPRVASSDIVERFTVEMQGPTLTVVGPKQGGGLADIFGNWRGNQNSVDVEVTVPTRTACKINTGSAPIALKGTCGGADVTTGSGDITLDTVDGDLRLRTGSADASVELVTGEANTRTGSGDVRFGETGGSLHAGFGSGNLEIGTARGPVRSRAGSGDLRIDAVFGDVDLGAGSGTITLGLPAGVSARLDVTSGSGRVHSDLPIEDQPLGNRGSITVRTRTGSGDVRLFRAAA
jgi:DUF4097 and DUF4098 domain-containing protein YvlB